MTPPEVTVRQLEDRLAPIMFTLAFLYLCVTAGLIHRANQPEVTPLEMRVMEVALAGLWPIFVGEAISAYLRRLGTVSRRTALLRILLVLAAPPFRMAWLNPATNAIWFPRLGWRVPGKPLLKTLDRIFGGPMLLFAFLILPVLLIETYQSERVKDVPEFAFALHVGTAMIWVAFAVEFVMKVSAAPNWLNYLKERWLDLAIVALPTLEFVLTHWVDAAPLARLFRLSRAISPTQIGAINKAYRLRGLMMKGWHAFLLLEGLGRILGNTPEKRLRRVENQIVELEEQLAELKAEAEVLRQKAERTTA